MIELPGQAAVAYIGPAASSLKGDCKMSERVTSTEQTVTTTQPPPVTEHTTTTTTQTQPAVTPATGGSVNINAPSGTETAGGVSVNVPPTGGVTSTTTTTTPDINVNNP